MHRSPSARPSYTPPPPSPLPHPKPTPQSHSPQPFVLRGPRPCILPPASRMAPPQHRCFLDLRHDDAVPLTILTRGRPCWLCCACTPRFSLALLPLAVLWRPHQGALFWTTAVRAKRTGPARPGQHVFARTNFVLRGACAILLCRVHAALSHGFVCASGCRVFGYAVYLRMCSFKPITHSVMTSNRPKPISKRALLHPPDFGRRAGTVDR